MNNSKQFNKNTCRRNVNHFNHFLPSSLILCDSYKTISRIVGIVKCQMCARTGVFTTRGRETFYSRQKNRWNKLHDFPHVFIGCFSAVNNRAAIEKNRISVSCCSRPKRSGQLGHSKKFSKTGILERKYSGTTIQI